MHKFNICRLLSYLSLLDKKQPYNKTQQGEVILGAFC